MREVEEKASLTNAKMVTLWVQVFFTGWFVMQTELVGARALTPYFGNSIFVWGSVIAVFLLALALGYGAGGRLTRKHHSYWPPAVILIAAGALTGLSVLYQESLCSFLAMRMDIRWGALLGSIALYAAPMILAGMISPYAVHLAARSRSDVGHRAGMLYAISTMGSFVGSLVTSFQSIPSYSLQIVMLSGAVLVALTAIVTTIALSGSDRTALGLSAALAAVVVVVACYAPRHFISDQQALYMRMMIGVKLSSDDPSTLARRLADGQRQATRELAKYGATPTEKAIFSMETAYHRVQVTQQGPIRLLTFGEAGFKHPQTAINLNDINAPVAEYTQNMLAPILYKQNVKRILIIGLGGGDVARRAERCFPNAEMDVVEIDPTVVKLAQDYFFWKPSKNVTVYTMDGRTLIGLKIVARQKPYDWVLLDAFDNDFLPFHMTTVEFYSLVSRILAPDGVLSINTWINHSLYSYEARTVKAAFGNVDAFFGHRSGNVILVAQNGRTRPMTLDEALAARKKASLPPDSGLDIKYITSCLLPRPNWEEKGEILTDLWAPVERMLSTK